MSGGRMPSRSEVMEWSPQQLADYLRKMNLSDCDRTVLKNSINGKRFVNLSENDLLKFPKLLTPMIFKLSADISKNEEKRGLFGKISMTPKFHEPVCDVQSSGDNHSDDDANDYENPDDEDSNNSDYEKPDDDVIRHYELPPSERPGDLLAHKLRDAVNLKDSQYIDTRNKSESSRDAPPAVCPRPPVPSLSAVNPSRERSPQFSRRCSEKLLPGPPKIFRSNKPGRNSSPIRGPNLAEKPSVPSQRSKPLVPPPSSSTSIGRSNSSVRPSNNDTSKFNTFPFNKTLPPRPKPPRRPADSLPPSVGSQPFTVSSAPDIEGWDDDEFDDDDDYENQSISDEDEAPNDDGSYEPPPTEPSEDLPHKLFPALPCGDGDYIDNRDRDCRGPPPAVSPRPPVSPLPTLAPRLPSESPSGRDPPLPGKRPPQIFRGNKPGRNMSPIRGTNTEERPPAPSRRPPADAPEPPARPRHLGGPPPSSVSVSRSNSSVTPSLPNRFEGTRGQTNSDAPKHNTFPLRHKNLAPHSAPPSRHGDSLPPGATPFGSLPLNTHPDNSSNRFRPPPQNPPSKQGMDPRWYVGKMSRGQAESYLKQVSKDGAYLVRDSSQKQSNQPYTLMVLFNNKVFNIQIRHKDKKFQLGTGLKAQESFPSVCDIIKYHSQCHLLLIDAKNRSSGQQNQCLLSEPAGIYMTESL
ncbi:lymphocyte cytosolic protein 2a [Corythoichthys intestinalis]|uniref:lymphocyte cytosolic protein 2a n=1 Tax=Corythoichthys intestinalis TaxID=161448 RepID=UPI0025A5B666|nr:lymphocyte cytosolic protein 2a [Corythoichthys intestinalis]